MFMSQSSKEISTAVRVHSQQIKQGLFQAFEMSIVNCHNERQFLSALINQLNTFFNSLSIQGVLFSSRNTPIHAKPIVNTQNGRCELGDLLVVIKYHLSTDLIEAKSIIYQIKLCKNNSSVCYINQRQLSLLCDWPSFSFGGKTYNITPSTLEFGSYMLEPRNVLKGNHLFKKYKCYGISPDATLVKKLGPTAIDITSPMYARGDANNYFSHLAFEIGEHHCNQSVKDFIEALYRYIDLSPDPPGEFDEDSLDSPDDGFAVIEINVKTEKEKMREQKEQRDILYSSCQENIS